MLSQSSPVTQVVSPEAYSHILTTPHLGSKVLPEGLRVSPYEILDYQGTLTLTDPEGGRAIIQRAEQIRFLQDGVGAILDHFWGDGVALTGYRNSAGRLVESFGDGHRHHLAITLPRPTRMGEQLTVDVERTALASFTRQDEWLETTIDHPIRQLGQQIVFPPNRRCQAAELVAESQILPLRPINLGDGRTILKITIPNPRPDRSYLVRWRW